VLVTDRRERRIPLCTTSSPLTLRQHYLDADVLSTCRGVFQQFVPFRLRRLLEALIRFFNKVAGLTVLPWEGWIVYVDAREL
jgi:hypothetical protein